jgi:8-oxo-dGTP diphosphatase
MGEAEQRVLNIVEAIVPLDKLEAEQKQDAVAWIRSGAPLFRVKKPDVPPKHLVSYFLVVDPENRSALLVDHLSAEKWLPSGGHVEQGEDSRATVEREALEELEMKAEFLEAIGDKPLFVTSTLTVGKAAGHTDVSLWYVIRGSAGMLPKYDTREFAGIKWFTFNEILQIDPGRLDPHLPRFMRKLHMRLQG